MGWNYCLVIYQNTDVFGLLLKMSRTPIHNTDYYATYQFREHLWAMSAIALHLGEPHCVRAIIIVRSARTRIL